MFELTVSIVRYNHSFEELKPLVDRVAETKLKHWTYLVDNSPAPYPQDLIDKFGEKFTYLFVGKNVGFGAGHNLAIRPILETARYHLVLNPDIMFQSGVLEHLYRFMEDNGDIGHVMPKIIYPDGSLQYVCKLIPSPVDLIFKRFIPNALLESRLEKFQLKFTGYNKQMDVPYLSGCFMFLRVGALKEIGLFDESFFMYPEDIDLTRRMHARYRTVFYPEVQVIHEHAKGSYVNKKLLYIHMVNMIKYFNKWGWFFDSERQKVNKEILNKLEIND